MCCGLGNDCVVMGMNKIEIEAREVCSLADDYDIMKSELDDKWQEVGDLEEDVMKNTGMKREGFIGPQWWDVACQPARIGVYKSIGVVAPVFDRKAKDGAVQVAVPLWVSTSGVKTDGQVEAVATPKTSYASVVTQATLVPTGARNGTNEGTVPPSEGVGP